MGSLAWSGRCPDEPAQRLPRFEAEPPIRFSLGEVEYAALPGIWYGRLPLIGDQRLTTVIPTDPAHPWTKETFCRFFDGLEHEDDASEPEFRQDLLFCGCSQGAIELSESLIRHLKVLGLQYHVVEMGQNRGHQPISGGAYLWSGKCLRPVYRLYDDRQSCFMHYFQPATGASQFHQLRISGRHVQSGCVTVPSRIAGLFRPRERPLTGKRFLVKDVFDMKGIRMTLCDKAYYGVSSPAQETAVVIQRLSHQGATVVGTAKLSSMISWEEPSECMDYPAPFNPRGDGLQSPAGSSSGSAAAIASYEWLDFAIGTDSTGSCRRPAMVNGCFGHRVSTGALPLEGMAPCFPLFDTPAVFTRDVCDLKLLLQHWGLTCSKPRSQAPTTVIIPTEFFDAIRNPQQRAILHAFIGDISASFLIQTRRVSLPKLWKDHPPPEAGDQPLESYLQDVGPDAFFHDFYLSTSAFRETYFRKHRASPPVNRMTAFRWERGSRITPDQRLEAGRRLGVYKTWLLQNILHGENPIMVLPIMNAEPNYRDNQSCGLPTVQEAWDQLWLAPVLGSPEVTVPIGQIPFVSKKTGVEEVLPVAISIMGLPGTDVPLIENVETVLRRSNRPSRVATGRQMFVEDWEMV